MPGLSGSPLLSRLHYRTLLPLAALLSLTASLHAQPVPDSALPKEAFTIALDQPAPASPKVKIGKLDNGIHYYIRANAEPKNRAELRLVVDAGSVLEDESQLGLAHMLEHMAFNGTEHFKKQEIVSFMESIGMKFGADLNASTSFDETTYMLQLPTDNPAFVEKGFLILNDWAQALTLDPEEIKLERGVVIEEWRLGRGVQGRIRDQLLPILLKDSRYAKRLPIGTVENLQNFKPEDLRRFYQDWYRPELMAVVAVGDFDPVAIEQLLRKSFAGIPASKNPKPRTRYDVPAHSDTKFAIFNDPELPATQIGVMHKFPTSNDWSVGGYRQRMVEHLFNGMLSTRFQELTRQANPPFIAAAAGQDSPIKPLSEHVLQAVVTETGAQQGLEALLMEAKRAARLGFAADELERQKTNMLRGGEQQYASRDSRASASHAAEMIRSYLTGESIPGAEYELALTKRFLPTITLAEVNQFGQDWMSGTNTVVTMMAPAKPGLALPTAAELAAVLAKAADGDIKPRTDTTNNAPLLASVPKGSKVTASQSLDGGLTEWTLGNGIKVILKPTDFKKDEILFTGFSQGGTSRVSDQDYIPASTAVTVIANGGLGQFNTTDLQRKLTGKIANVAPFISEFDQGLRGGASPADLETLFQLIYLRMTTPRADATYFTNFKAQAKVALQNRLSNPAAVFDDAFTRLMYQNHARRQPQTLETLDKFDLDKSLAIYQERLGDATDFTFIFVGNIDLKVMQPLVEIYIGGLPVSGRKQTWKDVGVRTPTGVFEETVRSGLEPQSSTRIVYTGPFNIKSLNERTLFQGTVELVQTRLRNVMREQLGGTYSVQTGRDSSWRPIEAFTVMINFSSDPARAEEMSTALFAEIEKLKTAGPTDVEVADEKQTLLRLFENSSKQNSGWMGGLTFAYSFGVNPGASEYLAFPKSVESMTVASVRKAVGQYFNKDNHIRVVLLPEKMPAQSTPAADVKK